MLHSRLAAFSFLTVVAASIGGDSPAMDTCEESSGPGGACKTTKRSRPLSSDHLLMQLRPSVDKKMAACCADCSGHPFCSPRSKQCYSQRSKDYYEPCAEKKTTQNLHEDCCGHCSEWSFCSPRSGTCYDRYRKHYYKQCAYAHARDVSRHYLPFGRR
eukprot:TRINITY_DN40672_c0_g1_i1.p1 TRINITY_DN40672_c0_g1~~TRINITY_DN40672_c0_g1_i1.p1  ORF type:complete len:177 (-),score=11.37 TRINITY_DN40672_c0_g1_i1:226-699(-)